MFSAALIRVIAGVGVLATAIAIAIAWRLSLRPETAPFGALLGWQLLTWLPWVPLYYLVRYLIRRLGTYQEASTVALLMHTGAALMLASFHVAWFWLVSRNVSPLLGLPDTRYGVYAFFFIFWFLMNLLLYWAILARPGPVTAAAAAPDTATIASLAVRKGRTTHMVPVADIQWIEAQSYYAALHTDTEQFLLRKSLARLAEELDPQTFVRVHRSTIVNLAHVKGIATTPSGATQVLLSDGSRRGVSRRGLSQLKAALPALK